MALTIAALSAVVKRHWHKKAKKVHLYAEKEAPVTKKGCFGMVVTKVVTGWSPRQHLL